MFVESLRHEYPLSDDSIIFDIGGYKGEWSKIIFEKYHSKIYCFEPVFKIINSNIKIYNHGIGGYSRKETIKIDRDRTGRFCKSGEIKEIQIIDIIKFLEEENIQHIDLMKINIEGMEYELLNRLIGSGKISIIKNIQVQFHNVTPTSDMDMYIIQQELKKTHFITWQYRYIWENWQRNENI